MATYKMLATILNAPTRMSMYWINIVLGNMHMLICSMLVVLPKLECCMCAFMSMLFGRKVGIHSTSTYPKLKTHKGPFYSMVGHCAPHEHGQSVICCCWALYAPAVHWSRSCKHCVSWPLLRLRL